MKIKENRQTLAQGAVILMASTMLAKIIGAIFKIPVSNLLGDEGFGYFSFAYDLFSPLYMLSSVGFPVAAAKLFSDNENLSINIVKNAFFKLSVILFAVFLSGSLFISLKSGDFKSFCCYAAMSPSIIFCGVMSVYRGYFESRENMLPVAVSDVILALCKLLLGLGFTVLAFKISGKSYFAAAAAILGVTFGCAVSEGYLYLKSKKSAVPSGASVAVLHTNRILKTTLPIAAAALAGSITNIIDSLSVKTMLAGRISPDLLNPMYGVRSKAYTLFGFVISFVSVIGISAVSSIVKKEEKNDNKKAVKSVMNLSAVISVPAGLGLTVLSGPIMNLLFSGEYSTEYGGEMLFAYGIAAVFAGLCIPLITVMQSYSFEMGALFAVAFGAVIKLALNIILFSASDIGVKACANTTAVTYFAMLAFVLVFLIIKRVLNFKMLLIYLKPVLPAVISVCAAYFISEIKDGSLLFTALAVIAAAVIYLALILLFRIIDLKELKKS